MRASGAHFGGADGTGVTFLQTAAEKLDVPDSSVDIVYRWVPAGSREILKCYHQAKAAYDRCLA